MTLSDSQVALLDAESAVTYGTPHEQIAGTLPRAQGGENSGMLRAYPPKA